MFLRMYMKTGAELASLLMFEDFREQHSTLIAIMIPGGILECIPGKGKQRSELETEKKTQNFFPNHLKRFSLKIQLNFYRN